MPNANHDRGANHDGGDADSAAAVAAAVPGKNGVARDAGHNKVAVAAVREKNGGVHNSGDAAGKADNNRHDDGRR